MSEHTLFDRVWEAHRVGSLPDGRDQLFVGLHLVHEVTSPQAFAMLDELGLPVAWPDLTVATVDHIVPTEAKGRLRPLADPLAEGMLAALAANCERHGVRFYGTESEHQGIVHVIGPELGLTQPGKVICCGDSHTSTHGAFGAIAFGIGTTQVRDVLATQTLAMARPRVRRVQIDGALQAGVYAKDVILHIIRTLGVHAGGGWAYEFAGSTIDGLDMAGRMTVCNMAIEGGARVGYCNPDAVTFAYLRGRPFAPGEAEWEAAEARWRSLGSGAAAVYDDVVRFDAADIAPTVTWGTSPGQAVGVDEAVPGDDLEALEYMGLRAGTPIAGTPVDVAFIGSCTNGRLEDLREVARHLSGHRVASGVRALVVPGSRAVATAAAAEGLDLVFRAAGFEWREPGCSMCLAMNPDKLSGRELCASSSNRNFRGRQGSPTGRTMLMSPLMVAAAAVTGRVSDAREVFAQ